MKRGGPLPRRTRLKNRSALNRQSELTRTAMKPKPAKHDPAETLARQVVRARSGGVCELDGRTPATEMHHRQNRSQGGDWTAPNLLHLCSAHHLHITTHPQAAREQGWFVPSWIDPARTPVWIFGREFVLLTPNVDYATTEELAS